MIRRYRSRFDLLDKLLQLSTLLSVQEVRAAAEVFLVDKDVGDGSLACLVLEVSLFTTIISALILSYPFSSRLTTYLDITALATHLIQLDDAYFALVQAELVDHALGLGAVGAVGLAEHRYEVLRDELLSRLFGRHLAWFVERAPVGFAAENRRCDRKCCSYCCD